MTARAGRAGGQGRGKVADSCSCMDAQTTRYVTGTWHYSPPIEMVYQLFQRVVKPALHSNIPQPALGHEVKKYNAFYTMHPPDQLPMLVAGINALERVLGYDPARTASTLPFLE